MTKILTEVKRSQMNIKNKQGDDYTVDLSKGRNRYMRRVHSKLGTSVNQLNRIDMNKLFKEDILDINLEVAGETKNAPDGTNIYTVRISFGGFLDELHQQLKNNPNAQIDLKTVTRALVKAFNSENVYIRCDCPDFIYRFAYWLSKDDAIVGEKEDRPPTKKWTNPNNTKGSSCKHIAIALANTTWLIRTGNVIRNYIGYMEKHYQQLYADVIYPAIYEKPYEEDNIQQDMFDISDMETGPNNNDVDTANKWSRTKGQWQKGNEYRFRPNDNISGQQEFDLDSLSDETTEEEQ